MMLSGDSNPCVAAHEFKIKKNTGPLNQVDANISSRTIQSLTRHLTPSSKSNYRITSRFLLALFWVAWTPDWDCLHEDELQSTPHPPTHSLTQWEWFVAQSSHPCNRRWAKAKQDCVWMGLRAFRSRTRRTRRRKRFIIADEMTAGSNFQTFFFLPVPRSKRWQPINQPAESLFS